MSPSKLTLGVVGAIAAAAATGATAGGVLLRYQRKRGKPDPPRPFEQLDPDRTSTVQSEDGVPLHVEEIGPPDAPLTVVFVHGYALSLRSFYYQRAALREKFGDRIRLVFYDQRGHGMSGASVPGGATIDQLGRDLYTVIDAVVPIGPIVLVGHSMGGMSLLSFAQQFPELFAAAGPTRSPPKRRGHRAVEPVRVVGVALIATSAGQLAQVSLGLPALINRLRGPLAPMVLRSARRQAYLIEHSRRLGRDVAWIITRRFSFGSADVSPQVVDFINEIIAGTRIETIADFYSTLMSFDLTAALAVLAHTDVVIVAGERDLMTPVEHSRAMAAALPSAELVVGPGAGHVVILEQPDVVDRVVADLVGRAAAGAQQAVGRADTDTDTDTDTDAAAGAGS
jgi:pimeloyl-ACP methyl ester carboxylesterase